MTSSSGLGKVEDLNKKVAFSNGDTFVSQYGSHFSNPDIRRLQTTRPPTQNTRTTKSSAAEALNVVMTERTGPRAEPKRKGAQDEQSIQMDLNLDQQTEEANAAAPATTKAWDYIKAMTHPNTPLLLLSPLPSIEDSALFLGDQSIQNDVPIARVNLSDESCDPAKGKKRQREAVKMEEVYRGSKKLKPNEQLPQDKAAHEGGKVDKVAHQLDKSKGRGKGLHADESNKPLTAKESKDKHPHRKEDANPHSASSSSRSPSLSPPSTENNESKIGHSNTTAKQDAKPVYSNGDQCKYNTKEQDRDVEAEKNVEAEKERHSKKNVSKGKDVPSSDSKSSSKRRGKTETEKTSSTPTTRREADGPPVSSGKLREEATKLKHLADNVFKSSKAEGLNYYLFAGLKFLECCQQLEREAESKPEALKSAFVMYRDTAKFFENCGAMCLSNKEYARASLCYKCMAVALARAFILQKEKLKRLRDELWSQLNKSTSPPVSVSSAASRASSMSPSPTYKSIPSPSSGNVGPSQPPGVLQKELFFLSEVDDIFKALDAWNKAGVHCTGKLADLEVPFTLDSFFLPGAPPIFSVIDYVHKAAELL